MKTLVLTFALIAGSFINTLAASSIGVPPADSATYKLTIHFPSVARRTGTLYIGLVNKEADFNGDLYRKTRLSVPATGDVQVSFEGLPAGRYAVKVFQDLNENMKLDFTGQAASEPVGFSNVKMLTAPPTFAQSAFDFNAPKTITIDLLGL